MKDPLVSVSLVAYNQEPFIRQAIESVLIQDVDFRYEIVIHDDASTDNTADIILEYAEKFPDIITPIIQTKNKFSGGTEINASITIPKANGKYIAFLEADDYWIDRNKLSYQTRFLESNPNISMCFTATKHIFPTSEIVPTHKRYSNKDSICTAKDIILKGGRLVDMGSAMVRRSVFMDVPDWYHSTQIWDISVPLLSMLHGEIQYLDKVTSVYRYNTPGSWTQTNVKNRKHRIENLMNTISLLEGFDESTYQKYHNLIQRNKNSLIIELLLLSDNNQQAVDKYYPKLTNIKKFEYKIFNRFGSFKIWDKYRQIIRTITGY